MVWNRELKKLAAAFLTIFAVSIAVINIGALLYCNRVRLQYNAFLGNVLGTVAEAYPEAAVEELIEMLDRGGNEEKGSLLLAQYGLFDGYGSPTTAVQEKLLASMRISSNLIFVVFFLTCGVLGFCYLRKRQSQIAALTSYMETLNRGAYKLEVEDNADDELSGLRNEIYKLTVLLREQAERALEQKRALADSVTDISHQLKTPLTSVTVLVDNLSENMDMDSATRQRFLSEITRQITGMSWLISTMMKLSRLDAGVVELEREHVELKQLVEEALRRLEIAAEWCQITFAVDIPQGAAITADRKWTEEALMNLVKNAIEHSPEGAVVTVCGEENDVYTQISVRDSGAGITEEEREKLFRRFYRGSTDREDSTGIGLALAKEIVEKQGGRITVDSQKGRGTMFAMRFLKTGLPH